MQAITRGTIFLLALGPFGQRPSRALPTEAGVQGNLLPARLEVDDLGGRLQLRAFVSSKHKPWQNTTQYTTETLMKHKAEH